jgi:hypothetical protein
VFRAGLPAARAGQLVEDAVQVVGHAPLLLLRGAGGLLVVPPQEPVVDPGVLVEGVAVDVDPPSGSGVISPWFSDQIRAASSGVDASGFWTLMYSITGAMACWNSSAAIRSRSCAVVSPENISTRWSSPAGPAGGSAEGGGSAGMCRDGSWKSPAPLGGA